jgi:hypothetical protein
MIGCRLDDGDLIPDTGSYFIFVASALLAFFPEM